MLYQRLIGILFLFCFFPQWTFSHEFSNQNEIKEIESRIERLTEILKNMQLHQIKEEVEGQELMIADWEAYAEELKLIRKQEEEERKISSEIKQLKQRKAALLESVSKLK